MILHGHIAGNGSSLHESFRKNTRRAPLHLYIFSKFDHPNQPPVLVQKYCDTSARRPAIQVGCVLAIQMRGWVSFYLSSGPRAREKHSCTKWRCTAALFAEVAGVAGFWNSSDSLPSSAHALHCVHKSLQIQTPTPIKCTKSIFCALSWGEMDLLNVQILGPFFPDFPRKLAKAKFSKSWECGEGSVIGNKSICPAEGM